MIRQKRLQAALVLALTFLLFIPAKETKASHMMGADLTYTCLGNGLYRFRLSFYRDCVGILPSTPTINFSSSCSGNHSFTLALLAGYPQDVATVCSTATTTCHGGSYTGIQEYIYEGTINMNLYPACADWRFSFSDCCRNAAITTITGSGSDNMWIYSLMNNTNGLCNNSPSFSNRPVPFACLGQNFTFNHGAYDVDGDSLVYSLIPPKTSATTTVTYLAGHSYLQPVISTPPVVFSTVSGDVRMHPTQGEVTVFAVLVSEYRNGVLIGQVERDIQLTIDPNCNNRLPTLAGIDNTPVFAKTICVNVPYCFNFGSADLNTLDTTRISWDYSIPGATVTHYGTGRRDSARFCWTPTLADVSNAPHCFTATVVDNFCPYFGSQIYSYCLTVEQITANAGPDQTMGCVGQVLLAGSGSGSVANHYQYNWIPLNVANDTLLPPTVGTYCLVVMDSAVHGCVDTDCVNVNPGIGVPVANYSFTTSCTGGPVPFTDLSNVVGGTIVGWNWSFGDGSPQSSQQNPTHQFPVGTWNVRLIITTLAGCTDTIIQQVVVNTNIPTASFASIDVCQGFVTNLTDQSIGGPITTWSWNFGDPASGANNTSNLADPNHLFTTPATYIVTLTVTNAAGCQDQTQQNVTVFPNPVINVGDQAICNGQSVTLTGPPGYSSYNWIAVSWTQSITVSPNVTTVYSLVVIDNAGCTGSDPATVTVNPLPVPNAGIDQTICFGTSANLGGSGGGAYLWTPGGMTGSNVTVTPASTTTYILTVTTNANCTATDAVTINVNQLPTVDAGNNPSVCKGNSTTLTASSGAGNYLWNPGNYNSQSITVTPPATTTYTVTVSDLIGCSGTDMVTVTVNPIPVAAYTDNAPVCIGDPVNFTNQSQIASGTINQNLWDFGNSQTSTLQDPSETYLASGTFNITLITISDAGCRDTINNSVVVNPLPTPDAGPDVSICPGFSATLNGSGGVGYLWNPGGFTTSSITVSPSANTGYSLIVTDANGCQNSDQAQVIINPLPVADAGPDKAICFGESTSLTAGSGNGYTYQWTPVNETTQTITVSPGATTTYDVTVTNGFGCVQTDQASVTVNPLPVASYSSTAPICQFYSIDFSNTSTVTSGSVIDWAWDFGNGTSGTIEDPTVPYNTAGNFNVILIVTTDQGCKDTISQAVVVNPKPVAQFVNTAVCQGLPNVFTNNSSISDATALSFAWNLGDNTTTTAASPSHQYASYGSYTASLLVTSQAGCVDSINSIVNVYALPVASFTTAPACQGEPATFTDLSSIPEGSIASWSWTFGDNSTSGSQSPFHTYPNAGNYPIHLNILSNHNCPDSTNDILRIIPRPLVNFENENNCVGIAIQLTDLSTAITGSIVQYDWNFGDGVTSTEQNPLYLYSRAGWYTVTLTITSDSGCVNTLVRPNAVNIYPGPAADFSSNAEQASDVYPLVNFVNLTNVPGSYYWNFGDSTTSQEYNPTHEYAQIGTYNVQLITVDNNGCVDTILRTIEIKPTSGIFIPNSFTPNADTQNDLFRAFTFNMVHLKAQIYDRWGLKIFTWDGLDGGWDGRVDGNPVQSDVYVYRIETVDVNDKHEVHIGHVSVVR